MRKRGWVDISIDILKSAKHPEHKTRLMYASNLSFMGFNAYFNDFLRKGLLEETNAKGNGVAYVISDHGKTLLTALESVERILSEVPHKVEPPLVNVCML